MPPRFWGMLTAPRSLAPDQLDRPCKAGHVDQPDIAPTATEHQHAAVRTAHGLCRGLDHDPQPRVASDDLHDVEALQPDEQITAAAVGAVRTPARRLARRRLRHRRGLPVGQLGRYRSWKASASFSPSTSARVDHTPTASRKSPFDQRSWTGLLRLRWARYCSTRERRGVSCGELRLGLRRVTEPKLTALRTLHRCSGLAS
jgi:hypothetical protein